MSTVFDRATTRRTARADSASGPNTLAPFAAIAADPNGPPSSGGPTPAAAPSATVFDANGNFVGNFATIQAAVDAADTGALIQLSSGTFTGQVSIAGKNDLTITTARNAVVTIKAPSDIVGNATDGTGRGIDAVLAVVNSANLTVTGNITIDGAGAGATADTTSNRGDDFVGVFARGSSVDLEGVAITGVRDATVAGAQRGYGVRVDNRGIAGTQLGFRMNGGSIADFQKGGAIFYNAAVNVTGVKVTGAGATPAIVQNGIVVYDSTGTISGNTVGAIGFSPLSSSADTSYSGLIVGASNTDLAITNNTLTSTNATVNGVAGDPNTRAIGIQLFTLDAANSGGSVSGNVISGVDRGISISGDMGPNAVALGTNTISGIDATDAFGGGIYFVPDNDPAIAFDLTGSGFADTLGGGSLADTLDGGAGDDTLIGNDGNDTLTGGAGTDTAVYDNARASYTITGTTDAAGFLTAVSRITDNSQILDTRSVSTDAVAINDGTDTLSGIEALSFADKTTINVNDPIQLFGADGTVTGTYTDLQAALDASSDGSTIRVRAGTYAGNLQVAHAVTILGANAGVAGGGKRGDETVIAGGIAVTTNGVTIDGVSVTGQSPAPGSVYAAGIYAGGSGFTLENSVLAGGPASFADRSAAILTGTVTELAIANNRISGYDIGTYVTGGGSTGSITGNLFQGVDGTTPTGLGTGVDSESSGVRIDGNSFDGIYGGSVTLAPLGVSPVDVTTVLTDSNRFTNTAINAVQIYATQDVAVLTGTDFAESFVGADATTGVTFDGAGGDDRFYGSQYDDTLTGGAGSDTALFSGTVAAASIATIDGTTTVKTANGGTDTLTGIEYLSFDQGTETTDDDVTIDLGAGIKRFDGDGSLVGTYATIQAALDASSDGDVIAVAAGTYDEKLTVSHAVTLVGANAGIAGTSATRGAETIITGINVQSAGVTVDGVEITGQTAPSASDGTYSGVYVAGNTFTFRNSVLAGGPAPDPDNNTSRAFLTQGVTGLDIGFNLITGYDQGLYISAGATGSVHDNRFQGDVGSVQTGLANGIVSETTGVTIGANVFDELYRGAIVTEPFGTTGTVNVGTYVLATNSFTNGVAQPIKIIPSQATDFVGTAFNDQFYGSDYASAATSFNGLGGDDLANGTAFADTFLGGAGNDVLNGLGGNDTLDGGEGDDTLDGGAGTDTASYASATTGVTVNLATTGAQATGAGTDTLIAIESLIGSSGDDVLTGNAGANGLSGGVGDDRIDGAAGNDRLSGNDGNDTLIGGLGNDTIDGGAGSDTASYATATSGVFVSLAQTGAQTTGGAGTDTLVSIENLIGGAGADTLGGDDAANVLDGGVGNDTLIGNAGKDTLRGGAGNDTLNGGLDTDTADYTTAIAGVTVDLSSSDPQDTIGAGTDTLISIESVTGSQFADTLTGGDGGLLQGLGGNDLLTAGAAGDQLIGGADNDTLVSGAGNDLLFGGEVIGLGGFPILIDFGNDTASFANATQGVTVQLDTSAGNPGTVPPPIFNPFPVTQGSATGDGDDTLLGIENVVGSAFIDTITGSNGANVIDGGAGPDTMTGLAGDDTYYVDNAGDVVNEAAKGGTDTVLASVSYTLAPGQAIENLATTSAAGTGAIDLTGNALANTITGNGGANTLDGAAGADTLAGLGGDDTYYVDDAGDIVVEAAGNGSDRVLTTVSYALADGQEIERLATTSTAGTDPIALTGNGFDQSLFGNAGDNVLDGSGGADTMFGYAGNDSYYVDNAGDATIEAADQGLDQVFTTIDLALATNIERLYAADVAATTPLRLTGNAADNVIGGNAGANVLTGGAGADQMFGYGGNDQYFVDNAGDRVFEAANGGTDRVLASVSYALSAGQEIEVLTTSSARAVTAINLTGNEFAQTIQGNAGNNVINGGAGADTMFGFAGNDTFFVDNARDRVIEATGGGTDLVATSVSYTLETGQAIERLATTSVAGTTALALTGNEIANTIQGNNGDNTIDGKGGSDILYGYAGADTFAFTTALGAGNLDKIVDFTRGTDKIGLSAAVFGGLPAGALDAAAFKDVGLAGARTDADDRILYNSRTGALFYDADGSGATAAVQFAVLQNKAPLTSADFVVG